MMAFSSSYQGAARWCLMLGREIRAEDTYLRGHGVHHESLEYMCLSVMCPLKIQGRRWLKTEGSVVFRKGGVCVVREVLKEWYSCNVGLLKYFYTCIISSDFSRRSMRPVVRKHKELSLSHILSFKVFFWYYSYLILKSIVYKEFT